MFNIIFAKEDGTVEEARAAGYTEEYEAESCEMDYRVLVKPGTNLAFDGFIKVFVLDDSAYLPLWAESFVFRRVN